MKYKIIINLVGFCCLPNLKAILLPIAILPDVDFDFGLLAIRKVVLN